MSAAQRQPWPMKWIVLAIIVVIVPYTYLTLHYRKPGRAFEPYHDLKDQANTKRLLNAGFQRISLVAQRPADPLRASSTATVSAAVGGLPASLTDTLLDRPLLPTEVVSVHAASTANSLLDYSIDLVCTQPDNKEQLAGAHAYVRDEEIWITPELEKLSGALMSRTQESTVRLTFSPGTLRPGDYRVTILGLRSSKSWRLQVR